MHSFSSDVVQKIKQIELYTRRLLNGALVGDARSAIKGTGFDFDQIREYTQGDDVRFIDWNASARADKLLVKQYMQERSRTVILAIDTSASVLFGDTHDAKSDVMAHIAGVLALVATYGNDNVALLLFSHQVETYIPPGRGRNHARIILEHLFSVKPTDKKTRIESALKHLAQLNRRDSIVFLVSDFIDDDFSTYLSVVSRMYDVVALRCLSTHETHMPNVGFITTCDLETGQEILLDTRAGLSALLQQRLKNQNTLFKRYGIDLLDIVKKEECIGDVVRFFRRRMRY